MQRIARRDICGASGPRVTCVVGRVQRDLGAQQTTMAEAWVDGQPIYRQLHDRVVAMILEGSLNEGDPLPSVRTVAADTRVNPLTVLKAYQQLADAGIVESRRGLGMYLNVGAKALLASGERERFLRDEWPRVRAMIDRLGLSAADLLNDRQPLKGDNQKSRRR